MKLLYTWVEKYRNLENIGLNWDSEFKVELAEDKEIINIKKKIITLIFFLITFV